MFIVYEGYSFMFYALVFISCFMLHDLHNLQYLLSQIDDLSLLQSDQTFAQEIWHFCWSWMSVVPY